MDGGREGGSEGGMDVWMEGGRKSVQKGGGKRFGREMKYAESIIINGG